MRDVGRHQGVFVLSSGASAPRVPVY